MFYNNEPVKTTHFTTPRFFKGGDEAVLLIHGYTGTPREMTWLGEQINKAGYTVSIPRLPGHGTNKEDFLSSNWKDWLRKVYDEYVSLQPLYTKIYIGGLSMGGVLSALLAAKFHPEKIFLCAPAFTATRKDIKYTPIAKFFIKTVKTNGKPFYDEPEFYEAVKDYCGVEYVAKAADLYTLQKMAIKQLPHITSKTLTILSKEDKSVPFEVKNIIDKNLKAPNKYVVLEKSSHILVDDVERELVASSIIDFLKN